MESRRRPPGAAAPWLDVGLLHQQKRRPGTLTRVVPKPAHSYHDWHVCEILARLATGELRVAVDGVEITRYKHGDPTVLKRGPIGMQLHAAKAEMEYKDIKLEADPKDDRLLTVK